MQPKCRWFIQPKNAQTNQAIADQLDSEDGQEERFDGQPINVWEAPWKPVDLLTRSGRSANMDFIIYRRKGGGKLEKADWLTNRGKAKCRQKAKPRQSGNGRKS